MYMGECVMKMIITADDFGISEGVVDGIIKITREGVLTQTGLFSNMECAAYAISRIKEYPKIALGIDLNICVGYPVSDPKLIPTLVQKDGKFLTSTMHRQKEMISKGSVSYEECYLEFDNQIKRFIDLTGELPKYLQGHAWGNETTERATKALADKYQIKTFTYYMQKYINRKPESFIEGYWANPKTLSDQTKEYRVKTQIEQDPLELFKNGKLTYLEEALKNDWMIELHTHAGFVDRDLIQESSYTLVRAMEAGFLCSKELKMWIDVNQVELISFADLV